MVSFGTRRSGKPAKKRMLIIGSAPFRNATPAF